MTLVVAGLCHNSAPHEVLETVLTRCGVDTSLPMWLAASDSISEFAIIATCNRVEVLAETDQPIRAAEAVATALALGSVDTEEPLTRHMYVHVGQDAVHHLFATACGLRSMATGESQILGQIKESLTLSQRSNWAGPEINRVMQHALAVGKRVHAQTPLDSVARSLIQVGLDQLIPKLPPMDQTRTLIVGAGAMSSLAAATVRRAGVRDLVVVNRDQAKGASLARRYQGRSRPWSQLLAALGSADLVITCTGSTEPVIDLGTVSGGRSSNSARDRVPRVFLDLALPADVDPVVATLPGVTRLGLEDLQDGGEGSRDQPTRAILGQVENIVAEEVRTHEERRRARRAAPAVAALRVRAKGVVEAETNRLSRLLPQLDEETLLELDNSMNRITNKFLHTPSLRAKQPHPMINADDYAFVMQDLFGLDPTFTARAAETKVG